MNQLVLVLIKMVLATGSDISLVRLLSMWSYKLVEMGHGAGAVLLPWLDGWIWIRERVEIELQEAAVAVIWCQWNCRQGRNAVCMCWRRWENVVAGGDVLWQSDQVVDKALLTGMQRAWGVECDCWNGMEIFWCWETHRAMLSCSGWAEYYLGLLQMFLLWGLW